MTHTIIGLFLIYLCAYVHMFLHEREHAKEMLRLGFSPEKLVLGLPIPFLAFLKLQFRSPKILEGMPITIYPLLVAGAATINKAQAKKLLDSGFKVQAYISSAGIWANLFYASLPMMLFEAWKGNVQAFLIFTGIACVCGLCRELVTVYLIPVASIAMGVWYLPGIAKILFSKPDPKYTTVNDISQAIHTGLTLEQVLFGCLFSGILLAVINLLPVFPMDGGKLVHALISIWSKQLANVYAVAAMLFLCGMIMNVLFSEGMAISHLHK